MQDELYHWGIKGMHWGVRRYQNPDGTLTEAGKRRYGSQYRTYDEAIAGEKSDKRVDRALKKGDMRGLSDSDLKRVKDRLDLRQKYSQAVPKNESRVKKVIADIAESAATSLAKKAFTELGERLFAPDDPTSEYSIRELDSLTDRQLKKYAERQQNKSTIVNTKGNIESKIDKMTNDKLSMLKKAAEKIKSQSSTKQKKKDDESKREKVKKEKKPEEKSADKKGSMKTAEKVISSEAGTTVPKEKSEAGLSVVEKERRKKIRESYGFDYYDFYHDALYHHGIKGQKWGVRRYQNPDGTLTPAGRERYLDAPGAYEDSLNRVTDSYYKRLEKEHDGSLPKRWYGNPTNTGWEPQDFASDDWKVLRWKAVALNEKLSSKKSKYEKALSARQKNLNPFSARQKYEDLQKARRDYQEAYSKASKEFLGESLAYIDSLPEREREKYESYVYELLGLDW